MHYNEAVTRPRIAGIYVLLAPLLMGGACEKKAPKADTGAVNAADRAGTAQQPAGPVDTTPLPGLEMKLEGDKAQLFYKLIGSFNSPCGASTSLRKAFGDASCKRGPFAVRYVIALIDDEIPEDKVREAYTKKYENVQKVKLDISKAPHNGNDDAPIKLIEFYDYACPHCRDFKPILERVATEHEGKTAEYFMQFPLEGVQGHANSKSAAQAALAANALGKFKDMHDMLFAKTPAHDHDSVVGYAKELGLDAAKFEVAYQAAAPQVDSDRLQGEGLGVNSTPTLFFNDRKYDGIYSAKYIGMWIDEELAVNR